MKNTNLTTILLTGVTAAFLIGCGGGGSSSTPAPEPSSSVPTGTYSVSAVDDNIVGATVSAPECATFSANGGASYTLKECIAAPSTITVVGGFIDVDGNGLQGDTEPSQTAPLTLKVSQSGLTNNFVVTPLSTLASQESNLTALAAALGVTQADLFKDTSINRELMRSVNAILISAREAGITKYNDFVGDLIEQIKKSGSSGVTALVAAKAQMMNSANLANYKAKYGVVFGGFVDDTSGIDLTSNPLSQVRTKNTVPAGKVRLGGFVYDNVIPNATIEIYDGSTRVGSGTSDSTGRYKVDLDSGLFSASKVLKLVAVSGTTKLVTYTTTDELKSGSFGSKVSSGTVEDLVISNVTTAKAVLVDKLNPTASTNAAIMTQTKIIVESMYGTDMLNIASTIKSVVDGSSSMTQPDTLALATAVATGTQVANTTYTKNITADPILNGQLNSTQNVTSVSSTTIRSIMEGKTLYYFDYNGDNSNMGANPFSYGTYEIKTDGSTSNKSYRNDTGTNWIISDTKTTPAGSIKWSSDGNIAYEVNDYWVPSKHTLLSKNTVTNGGLSATIYFMQDKVTSEPTEGFYTNFVATSNGSGTYNSETGRVTIHYYDTGGTYSFDLNETTQITRYGKTFYVKQWRDDDTTIYYLSGTTVYGKDYYTAIGEKSVSFMTDSVALLGAWKNMTPQQRTDFESEIHKAYPNGWSWSEIQGLIYEKLLSLVHSGA